MQQEVVRVRRVHTSRKSPETSCGKQCFRLQVINTRLLRILLRFSHMGEGVGRGRKLGKEGEKCDSKKNIGDFSLPIHLSIFNIPLDKGLTASVCSADSKKRKKRSTVPDLYRIWVFPKSDKMRRKTAVKFVLISFG